MLFSIDGVLILGDLVNANHQKPFTEPEKDIEEFEQVLALAKSIHHKVFYLPGNKIFIFILNLILNFF
jgi:UDP-2,3-diacylglucosamine pyrophosphatase LpxH